VPPRGAGYEIRDALLSDAHSIAEVLVESWRGAYARLLPDGVLARLSVTDRERFWSKLLAAPPPRTVIVVATSADGIVGFASAGAAWHEPAEPTLGQLYTIYVRPTEWAHGIGTLLQDVIMDRLRAFGFERLVLWVLETNARALRFYRRTGWVDDDVRQIEPGPEGIELAECRLSRPIAGGAESTT
jgi:GNAT superfamily N-acetyltransferase